MVRWAAASEPPVERQPPQAAYDAVRDGALGAAAEVRRAARAWGAGALDDAAFEQCVTALLVGLAAASWWQGAAAQPDGDQG